MNDKPIGVFDSGIGGLTVLRELFRSLSQESTLYLGDTARVPYGIRSAQTVTRYAFENTSFLVAKGIKLLVVACNTVSAVSLDEIKQRFPLPVLGVIEPGSRAAVRATRTGRIGVIGTEATVNSGAYTRTMKALDSRVEVFSLPCPLFVPLAEEGVVDGDIARLVTERYLRGFQGREIDTLVLGCTHYPLLKDVIAEVIGRDVQLIDSATETVREVEEILSRDGLARGASEGSVRRFYVTDSPERFVGVGERFLGATIEHIEKIDVGF